MQPIPDERDVDMSQAFESWDQSFAISSWFAILPKTVKTRKKGNPFWHFCFAGVGFHITLCPREAHEPHGPTITDLKDGMKLQGHCVAWHHAAYVRKFLLNQWCVVRLQLRLGLGSLTFGTFIHRMCNPFQTTPYLYVYMIQAPNLNLCNMYYIYILHYTIMYLHAWLCRRMDPALPLELQQLQWRRGSANFRLNLVESCPNSTKQFLGNRHRPMVKMDLATLLLARTEREQAVAEYWAATAYQWHLSFVWI